MILSLAGRIYAQAMRVREKAYARRVLPTWRPPVMCISVGNISWGGSGKTPLCSWLLRWSANNGFQPALLTRGYRARPPHLPYHVRTDSSVGACGDEPLMVARENPEAQVVVDPCRRRGGKWAWDRFQPDLFLLDDGLQHMAVRRDLDIVLLRPRDLGRDWNRVIPSGPWREGAGALQRASALVFNSPPETEEEIIQLLQRRVPGLHKPVFFCSYRVTGLRRVIDETPMQPTGEYVLVSAVGSPAGVEDSAEQVLSRKPRAHLRFADHHAYSPADWEKIAHKAEELGAQFVVCTPKDRVKLESWADSRLFVLDLDLSWHKPKGQRWDFACWLEAQVNRT